MINWKKFPLYGLYFYLTENIQKVEGQTIRTVKNASKALDIIINHEKREVGVSAISEKLCLPVSTTHRLLNSLKETGFVEQNPDTSKYHIGSGFLQLAGRALDNMDIRDIAYSYLEELKEKTGETANLVTLNKNSFEVIYALQIKSASTVGGLSMIGSRAPSYATGVGKVLLAEMEWSKVYSFYENDGIKQLTENTVSSLDELKERLKKVEEQGYAIDNEECEKGAACIAAPVKNHDSETIAAVSISGPTGRIMSNSFPKLVNSVMEQAEGISQALGYKNSEAKNDKSI